MRKLTRDDLARAATMLHAFASIGHMIGAVSRAREITEVADALGAIETGEVGPPAIAFAIDADGEEQLYEEAKKLTLRAGATSTSFLMHNLKCSYDRARAITSRMVGDGIIDDSGWVRLPRDDRQLVEFSHVNDPADFTPNHDRPLVALVIDPSGCLSDILTDDISWARNADWFVYPVAMRGTGVESYPIDPSDESTYNANLRGILHAIKAARSKRRK